MREYGNVISYLLAVNDFVTERLKLRRWLDSDRILFREMNSDPVVMRHMPWLNTPAQSDAAVDRIVSHFERYGFGLWAVALRYDGTFIGFTGLQHVPFQAPFTPAVEIGWRLRAEYWGRGFATEAARYVLHKAFTDFQLKEIVAMTTSENSASIRVIEKLGMQRDKNSDFMHPLIPEDHRLCPHILYRSHSNPHDNPLAWRR